MATWLWIVAVVLDIVGRVIIVLGHSAYIEAAIDATLSEAGLSESDLVPGALDAVRAARVFELSDLLWLVTVVMVTVLVLGMRAGRAASRKGLAALGGVRVVVYGVQLAELLPLVSHDASGVIVGVSIAIVLEMAAIVAACAVSYRKRASTYFADVADVADVARQPAPAAPARVPDPPLTRDYWGTPGIS